MKNKNKLYTLVFTVLFITGLGAAQFQGDPQLQEYRQPDITVDQEQNTVTATFYLENTGGSFAYIDDDSWIIEIQPKLENRFSFTEALSTIGVSQPDTCDDSRPENVHKEMVFSSSEKKQISITSPLNGEGSLEPGQYNLKALTVTGCATGDTAEQNVESVDPYGWGTDIASFTVEEDSTTTDPSDPETSDGVWIAYSNGDNCIQVDESNVPSNLQTYDSESSCVEDQNVDTGIPWIPVILGGGILASILVYRRRY